MSDYTELIDELRVRGRASYTGEGQDFLLGAADAIEALVKERDDMKREMHARELHHFEEEQRSVGFAAQLAKLSRLVGDGAPHWVLRRHISATPADALREHEAALIESLADHLDRHFQDIPAWTDAYREGVRTNEWMVGAARMTMSAIGVIRERARQVREGEA